MKTLAEYIWIDGTDPTPTLRSKTKVIDIDMTDRTNLAVEELPEWGFDGSSTNQAEGSASDCKLKPVSINHDPIRGGNNLLVLCEVFSADGTPHPGNTRAKLRGVLEAGAESAQAWFGFEQEYTLFKGSSPLGFGSEKRFPAAQGPYYCGVGADEVYGRQLMEDHLLACLAANVAICGTNAEVMPGQWEFQIGGPEAAALKACDDLWVARWLLYRLGENHGITATLDPKPITGDWNGAGMHTNFSTAEMRSEDDSEDSSIRAIERACVALSGQIDRHLAAYGNGYEMRLTGHHETCRFDEFKWGVADRTASVRIPAHVADDGRGYLEDRRPNANADPYRVASVLLETICL